MGIWRKLFPIRTRVEVVAGPPLLQIVAVRDCLYIAKGDMIYKLTPDDYNRGDTIQKIAII